MTFNFNARYALLTYSQCGDLDPWAVNEHLGQLRAECIIAREAHADGGNHLHCFVDFEENTEAENPLLSMSLASTRMFHLRTQHHKRVSTMRARMVTLWQGGLQDQMLAKSLEVEVAGMISSLQRVEKSFLASAWSLILDHYAYLSGAYKSIPTGSIERIRSHINIQKGSNAYTMIFQSLVAGYSEFLKGLYVVSLAPRRGDPPGTKSSGSRYASSRGPSPPS